MALQPGDRVRLCFKKKKKRFLISARDKVNVKDSINRKEENISKDGPCSFWDQLGGHLRAHRGVKVQIRCVTE